MEHDKSMNVYKMWLERLAETGGVIDSQTYRFYTLGYVAHECDIDRKQVERDFKWLYDVYDHIQFDSSPLYSSCIKMITKGYSNAKTHNYSYGKLCDIANLRITCPCMDMLQEAFPE